ncbi:MAG: hypothetical protein IPO62_05065 [Saprospiraceae bacterium]|nr:hypothetical protein [Saprospiraceae bacterium]
MKNLKSLSLIWILLLSVISISFATSPNLSPVSLLQEMLDKSYDGQLIVLPANVDEKLVIRRAVSLMTASPSVVKSLVIDAPGKTVKLLGNLNITENLDVESGFLDAGIYQLNYAHSKGLVKANSAAPPPPPPGSLTLTVPTSGTVAFPIGTMAGYTPVTVSATGAHTTDDLTASVVDRANLSEFTAPTPNGPRFAEFEWTVTEANSGGSNVNLKFGFPTDPNGLTNSAATVGKNDGALSKHHSEWYRTL